MRISNQQSGDWAESGNVFTIVSTPCSSARHCGLLQHPFRTLQEVRKLRKLSKGCSPASQGSREAHQSPGAACPCPVVPGAGPSCRPCERSTRCHAPPHALPECLGARRCRCAPASCCCPTSPCPAASIAGPPSAMSLSRERRRMLSASRTV